MANTSNSRISNLIASQVPFFVRNDHSTFVKFLEKYFEYLEDVYDNKNNNLVARAKNLRNAQNIDLTEDDFAQKLYAQFMNLIPETVLCDKNLLLKHIKDFYRAKGTEKATKFLLNVLFNIGDVQFYYPKKDILIASDGKWFVQRTIRVANTAIDFVVDPSTETLRKFVGLRVNGVTSKASAIVEDVQVFFEQGFRVEELVLSNIDGNFIEGETVYANYNDVESVRYLSSDIIQGIIGQINLIQRGTGYKVGDRVIIVPDPGDANAVGAVAVVSSVSTGNLAFIAVDYGGAGFRVDDLLSISGGGGSGANAILSDINADGSIHPNTYFIVANTIEGSANVNIANTILSTSLSTNFQTVAYPNLAIQFVRLPANTSNLRANTGNTTTIVLSDRTFNSNVPIQIGTPLNVNNQIAIVTLATEFSNTIQVGPFVTGNLDGKDVIVLSQAGFANTSNTRINTGPGLVTDTINLVRPITIKNVSNIRANTTSVNTVISLERTPITSNVFFEKGYLIQINSSNTTIVDSDPNTSTIIVSPGITGPLTLARLNVYEPFLVSQWSQNSNVAITNGTILLINNNVYAYAVNVVPNRASFNVIPNITSNLSNVSYSTSNGQLLFSNLKIQSALSKNVNLNLAASSSNVFFVVGDSIQIGSQNSVVTSIVSSSLQVEPGFYGGFYNNTLIIRRAPFNAYSNLTISTGTGPATMINLSLAKESSNVFFETFDSINVDNTIVLVTSSNTKNTTLFVSPSLPGGLTNRPFEIIKRANANTTIANAVNYWTYGNTGPARGATVLNTGDGYSSTPTIAAISNTVIYSLGILGRMEIIDGGLGYTAGDKIAIENKFGAYGEGAAASVKEVEANGKIKSIQFDSVPGHFIGGSGYRQSILPTANVITSTGNGANIVITSILGAGDRYLTTNTTIGAIDRITILSRGSGYKNTPTIDLTQSGDGKAIANSTTVVGTISYPGIWLRDDGQISAYNFLQDRDYYQKFSYVIRSSASTEKYRKPVFDLTHPAGMKMFGERILIDEPDYTACPCNAQDSIISTTKKYTYWKSANTISINYPSHGLSVNDQIGLEFTTGKINSISVLFGGGRYANGNIIINTDSGSGFSAYYNVNSTGTIVSTTILTKGNGYTSNYTLDFSRKNLTSNLTMTSVGFEESFTEGNVVNMLLTRWAANSNVFFTSGDTLKLKTPTLGDYIVIVKDIVNDKMNVVAPYASTGPSYNLINSNFSTATNFEVITQPAIIRSVFQTESEAQITKDGLYRVVFANTNWVNVKLEKKLHSIRIIGGGSLYNSNSYLVFSGGGGANANAQYFTNSRGSIVKVVINDYGLGYITEPTITANGSNSVPATFTTTLAYSANTEGHVLVKRLI